jgi:S-adenosylmethionine synthetase
MENKRWKTTQAKLVENKGWKTKWKKNHNILFTSEVVSPGHPDKCADIIADSIVDRLIIEDSNSRVASEVFVAGKHVVIGGEVKSNAKLSKRL